MKLKKIKINGFGKISEKEIVFSENLNIIFGTNESGKSTIQYFIKAMLFGFGKTRISGISGKDRYKPWNGGAYGGILEYILDDMSRYSVWRDFNSNRIKVHNSEYKEITNEFDKSKNGGVLFAQKHLGLNSELFEKTCYISQYGVRLDSDGQSMLSDKITNMIETGNENVSCTKALKILEKTLLEEVGTDRTSDRPINKIRNEISKLEKERAVCSKILDNTRTLEEQIKELKKAESGIRFEMAAVESLYETKKAEIQSINFTEANQRLKELNTGLKQKEAELKGVIRLIPTGSAVFDNDAAQELSDLEEKIKKLDLKFKILCGSGLGLLVYFIGSLLFNKDPGSIIGIVFGLMILSGAGLYLKHLLDRKSDIRDILEAAASKNVKEYFEKRKEVGFFLEKKKMIEEAIRLMQQQIGAVSKEGVPYQEFKVIKQDETDFSLEDKIGETEKQELVEKLNRYDILQLEAYQREKSEELRKIELGIKGFETEIKVLSLQAEKLPEIEEQLEQAREEEGKLKEFAFCLGKAKEILDESNEQLKKERIPDFSDKLSEAAYGFTGKYNNIKADAWGQGIKVVFEDGRAVPLELLSEGTIDQIYLALRTAGLNMLSETGETLPLIIDEPFSQYDYDRIRITVEALKNISARNQVIIFTCRQDEISILKNQAEIIKL